MSDDAGVTARSLVQALRRIPSVVEVQTFDRPAGGVEVRLWVYEGPGPTDLWFGQLAVRHLGLELASFDLYRIPRVD